MLTTHPVCSITLLLTCQLNKNINFQTQQFGIWNQFCLACFSPPNYLSNERMVFSQHLRCSICAALFIAINARIGVVFMTESNSDFINDELLSTGAN